MPYKSRAIGRPPPTELIDVQDAPDVLTCTQHYAHRDDESTRSVAGTVQHTSGGDGAIQETASRCASYGEDVLATA